MSWFKAVGKPAQRQKAKASTLHHTATSHRFWPPIFSLPYSFKTESWDALLKGRHGSCVNCKVQAKQIGLHHARLEYLQTKA